MSDVHFHSIDLNLLRLFDALAEERSVTRAGARLGLTQSAVSHALNRLRHVLADELFVRGPDGMRPTARAEEIAPRLRQGLHQLQLALAPTSFAPADTQRRFAIAAAAYTCTVLMPGVVSRLRSAAPAAELRATRLIALAVAFAPLVFVFFVPEILRLSFFTRALRLSISIVAVIGFYLPLFHSGRGATLGLLASAVLTSIWYVLGNPYGIDNMYIAAVTPVAVMAVEHALPRRKSAVDLNDLGRPPMRTGTRT